MEYLKIISKIKIGYKKKKSLKSLSAVTNFKIEIFFPNVIIQFSFLSHWLTLSPCWLARLGMQPWISHINGAGHIFLWIYRRWFSSRLDCGSQGSNPRVDVLQQHSSSQFHRHCQRQQFLVIRHLQIPHWTRIW